MCFLGETLCPRGARVCTPDAALCTPRAAVARQEHGCVHSRSNSVHAKRNSVHSSNIVNGSLGGNFLVNPFQQKKFNVSFGKIFPMYEKNLGIFHPSLI